MRKAFVLYQDLKTLVKLSLSLTVVFSSLVGYLLATETIDWVVFQKLFLGGFFLTGAANIFNQLLEIKQDSLMKRTKNRPLPTHRISIFKVFIFGGLLVFLGLFLLYSIGVKVAFLGALSFLIYVLIYTPMKALSPLAVFVGAFPGAMPFLLGWISATGEISFEAWILFLIQFAWQFPHFWAIAWFLDDDYKKAGYILLPTGQRDRGSAGQIVLYTIFLVLVSIIPAFGLTPFLDIGWIAFSFLLILGIILVIFAIQLYRTLYLFVAKKLMLACVIYLPLIQLIYLLDKYLR